jgi:hypothetical protein
MNALACGTKCYGPCGARGPHGEQRLRLAKKFIFGQGRVGAYPNLSRLVPLGPVPPNVTRFHPNQVWMRVGDVDNDAALEVIGVCWCAQCRAMDQSVSRKIIQRFLCQGRRGGSLGEQCEHKSMCIVVRTLMCSLKQHPSDQVAFEWTDRGSGSTHQCTRSARQASASKRHRGPASHMQHGASVLVCGSPDTLLNGCSTGGILGCRLRGRARVRARVPLGA